MRRTAAELQVGDLRLNLNDREIASAKRVIAFLLSEADALSEGVLCELWRAEAEQLRLECLHGPRGLPAPL